MRRVSIASVAPGMRVAAPFYNPKGDILLRSGTTLTDAYIGLLHRRGVTTVWIDDPDTSDIALEEVLSEHTRARALGSIAGLLEEARRNVAALGTGDPNVVRRYLQSAEFMRSMAGLPYWNNVEAINGLVDEAMACDPIRSLLTVVKAADDYEFAHAVDVAVTAVILGARLKLDRGSLRRLARGCLLHDIGMALVDDQVAAKPGKLDAGERAQMEQHTALGFEFLNRVQKDDTLANHVAFQHHERQDGKGYPRGLHGTNGVARTALSGGSGNILPIAEIAAVADIYDALSSKRPYRQALASDVVLLFLQRLAGTWLNSDVVRKLIEIVPPYPLATEIVVTEGPPRGCAGVVCRVDQGFLDRPTVRLLLNTRGERMRPFDLDLRRAPTVKIRALAPTSEEAGPLDHSTALGSFDRPNN